jgi:hypothetical protein
MGCLGSRLLLGLLDLLNLHHPRVGGGGDVLALAAPVLGNADEGLGVS